MKTKRCSKCRTFFEVANFTNDRTRADGLSKNCKDCARQYRLAYRDKIGFIGRKHQKLQERYGITIEEYNQKLEDQNHCCAICGRSTDEIQNTHHRRYALAVDHNHTTGKVRGLLCSSCNQALGLFQDNVAVLQSAQTYLVNHTEEPHGRKDHERVVTKAGIRPAKNARQVQAGPAKDPRKASQ